METYNVPVRILCVDDERNVLRSLERVFLDDDYEVVTAASGEEGLQIMAESGDTFQVVVSDYRMPVMNGVEFLKQVYAQWPDTVRIVLSGYADAGAIVAAINEGHIYKFIPKPWNDEELRVTIQNCLERYFLLRSNRELLEDLARSNQELEEKVRLRTEDLELRNKALEFSQTMLGSLPVGVLGIDENGLIAHCNTRAAHILKQLCYAFLLRSSPETTGGTGPQPGRTECDRYLWRPPLAGAGQDRDLCRQSGSGAGFSGGLNHAYRVVCG